MDNNVSTQSNSVPISAMHLRPAHYRLLAVASLGQIAGTLLTTIVGIIIPMVHILMPSGLPALMQGVIGAASLVGIMAGAAIFGPLDDRFGYRVFYRICPALVMLAALWGYYAHDIPSLIAALFIMGCGIGGEYSLDSAYISEVMPNEWKQFMVGVAKAASSLGNIGAAALSWWMLTKWDDPSHWNNLLLLSAALSAVTLLCRIKAYQSPGWLIAKGRIDEASATVKDMLGDDVELSQEMIDKAKHPVKGVTMGALFKNGGWRKVVFTGIPWACEGLGVYGFGVFLPVLVMALGIEHEASSSYLQIINSVQLTTYINIFVLLGFAAGLTIINHRSHVMMQTLGFLFSAVGLGLMLTGYLLHLHAWVAIIGLMAFELFLNIGPHLITFVLPTQVFPVVERGAGCGIAAAIGKAGAVIGVFVIPLLLKWGGITSVLIVSIAVMLLGALITALFRGVVKS
jgi:MFS family permease